MASNGDDKEFRKRIERLEVLIHQAEQFTDTAARDKTREIVQSILDLHGTGLARIMDHLAEAGEAGGSIIDGLAADDLVGSLLLLYGLHPLDLEERVSRALDKVRPYLALHGGSVALLGIGHGVVRLRMEGSCHGCPSSAVTLKHAIEEAIYEAAPDVAALEVEGVVEQPAPSGLVQIGTLTTRNGMTRPAGAERTGEDLVCPFPSAAGQGAEEVALPVAE